MPRQSICLVPRGSNPVALCLSPCTARQLAETTALRAAYAKSRIRREASRLGVAGRRRPCGSRGPRGQPVRCVRL